jgi:hypothetical protein
MSTKGLPSIQDVTLYMRLLREQASSKAAKKQNLYRGMNDSQAIANIRRNCAEMGTSAEGEEIITMYLAERHL